MHRLTNRLVALTIGALVVGAAVGCGGTGSSSGIPLDEWRTKAEQICVAARQQADASQPVTGAGNPAVLVRARAQLASAQARQIAELHSPNQEQKTVSELVKAMQRQAAALDGLADALLADPTATAGVQGAAVTVETDKVSVAAATLELSSCTTEASTATKGETDPGQVTSAGEGSGQGMSTQDG